MSSHDLKKARFLISIFFGLVATGVLFVALPLLTRITPDTNARRDKLPSVLISSHKPAPPPSEDRDKPKKQEVVEKEMQRSVKEDRRSQPKFDLPKAGISLSPTTIGSIQISMVSDFEVSDSLYMSAFVPTEVDQPPQPLRTFPPQYPYIARRDNIEGRVVLKFVVDTDGIAKEPRVVEAEPEGIFDESALKAIERYKFRPAMRNGKPVLCIVRLPISFKLD
jgi:protein TonB